MWHQISTAPFDRDLELAMIDSNGLRTIAYPCRRVLGGWIKAEIKTRVELRPTHWRDWSTDANVKRTPFFSQFCPRVVFSWQEGVAPRQKNTPERRPLPAREGNRPFDDQADTLRFPVGMSALGN